MEKNEKYIEQKREYNSKLSTFQISKDIHKLTKDYCKKKNKKIREFLEELILNNIKE